WMLVAVIAVDPGGMPRLGEITIDRGVLMFTLSAALLTTFLSGLAPALQAPHANLIFALREGERGQTGGSPQKRLRSALVILEVALSLILLVGAGLLVRSFGRLLR